MTLRGAAMTDESIEVVRSQLSELAGREGFPQRALNRADPAALALAAPHDVYFLGLRDIAAGASLDAATLVGRRVLVMDGATPIASAELGERDDDFRFQANEGPFVESTAAAITRAEADPELADGDYEVRVLRIPALYFMGIWLKHERDGSDVVIPLDPAPALVDAQRKYAPDELLAELREPARARLALDEGELAE
jgi:hypothetical protein